MSTNEKQFDLRDEFPLAYRSIIRRSFPWLVIYVSIAVFTLLGLSEVPKDPLLPEVGQFVDILGQSLLILGALICFFKLVYEIVFHHMYYYAIEEGHLVISAGIFLKQRGAFPLNVITDVYLDRNPLDFMFGLYDLYTSNPAGASHEFGDIQGLSKAKAVALQDYLVTLTKEVAPEAEGVVNENPPDEQPGAESAAERAA